MWAFAFGISEGEFIALAQARGMTGQVVSSQEGLAALELARAYLRGETSQLGYPIDWRGWGDFQSAVYRAVLAVPYGQTATYGQIAAQIGRPGAARAVGRANAVNPLPLFIPCHRLVGADGSLRGYGGAGGQETKRWLLALEQSYPPG